MLLVFVRICERNQRKKLPLATSTLVALGYKNYCVICTKKHFVFPIPLSITFIKIHFQYSKDYVPLPTCSITFFLTFLNLKILTYLQNLFARLRYKLGGNQKSIYTRPGLVTNPILFCWIFTIKDLSKRCAFSKRTIKVCVNCS